MAKSADKRLGLEIAKRRKLLRLSQERLGYLCGLHRTYVSEVERGTKSPTIRTLRAIASALETTASDLLASAETAGAQ